MSNEIKEGYLRVTEILSPFTGIEFVPDEPLKKAGDRGTMVHNYIEATLRGYHWDTVPEEIKPYYDSWLNWFDPKLLINNNIIEQRLYCDKFKITGQIDFLVNTPIGWVGYDWKTSSKPSVAWPLQAMAYMYLLGENGYEVDNFGFVHLRKDKPALIYEYTYSNADLMIFMKCLELYRYFNMSKTRKKGIADEL